MLTRFGLMKTIMKTIIALFATVTLCAGSSVIPDIPLDNSHYEEGVSRYIWMPDGEGVTHLVDLEAREDEPMSRNAGARNEYWLFTRNNRNSRQILRHHDANSVWNSFYRNYRETKVVIHGWNNDGGSGVNTMVTSAYLEVADVNVIVVDWRSAASGLYTTSVRDVPNVGEHLGHFLQWLINTAGGNWNSFHLIGFSLGAHIAGNAGRTVGGRPRRITDELMMEGTNPYRLGVKRYLVLDTDTYLSYIILITVVQGGLIPTLLSAVICLDPAGPQWGGNSRALNNRDGGYVECIHTDGRRLGIMDPIGDSDFYPNGGRHAQPGCWVYTCSHSRSYELFAASVMHNHLNGRRCNNLNEAENNRCTGATLRMGNRDLGKWGSGLYALSTGSNWPF